MKKLDNLHLSIVYNNAKSIAITLIAKTIGAIKIGNAWIIAYFDMKEINMKWDKYIP